MRNILTAMVVLSCCVVAWGHDTWLETNTPVVRVGDAVYIDCLLGNHGNDHRDFKLAGKVTFGPDDTWQVVEPDGQSHDLKVVASDRGMGPKDGYWSARFVTGKPGLHMAVQTSDRIVSYAPKRSVKTAKAFFLASQSLDKIPADAPGFDRVLGKGLEIVALTNPVVMMGPGTKFKVKVLYQGKPVTDARVSFIPRGQELAEGFDDALERKTDNQGVATFEFKEGNCYLIVAHLEDTGETGKGEGYDQTKYSATLNLIVPAVCPCCAE